VVMRSARSQNYAIMRTVLIAAILASLPLAALADDDSDIVTGCLMSNAEFGNEMAQICIKENQAARAEVARYPDELKVTVERCTRRKEMGWGIVKKCIDDDIAAGPALEAYARDHAALVERCQDEFRGREATRIKHCVDQALDAERINNAR
jgi:hypothetical protein